MTSYIKCFRSIFFQFHGIMLERKLEFSLSRLWLPCHGQVILWVLIVDASFSKQLHANDWRQWRFGLASFGFNDTSSYLRSNLLTLSNEIKSSLWKQPTYNRIYQFILSMSDLSSSETATLYVACEIKCDSTSSLVNVVKANDSREICARN